MRKSCTNPFLLLPLAVVALALLPRPALAQEGIYITDANIGGSGCPAGTTSVVLSSDGRALSILFDDYIAEDRDFAACAIAVALNIPEGLSVALVQTDYRGFANVPASSGARARFFAELFFAGQVQPVFAYEFPSGFDGPYLLSHEVGGPVLAPCGSTSVIARANTSIRTEGNDTLLTVDSADVTTEGITFELEWYECP